MGISNDFLKEFASAQSDFFHLGDGEEKTVKYLFAEQVSNMFDGGRTLCVRYHFKINGQEKFWDRQSRDLANQMAEIPENALISIKRTGQKSKTKYIVKKVKENDTQSL